MRVLVCGSRNWASHRAIYDALMKLHVEKKILYVIEGEARGADTIARVSAENLGIPVLRFPADWNKHGKAAGFIRNQQMLDEGKPDLVLAFWDGLSRGTKNMIELAKKAGVPVEIIPPVKGV